MKNLIIIVLTFGALTACTAVSPEHQQVRQQVNQIPANQLPKSVGHEMSNCPKKRFFSEAQWKACKEETRRELLTHKMMRENNAKIEKE